MSPFEYSPTTQIGLPVSVPVLLLPELSTAVVPLRALREYPATRPGGIAGAAGVVALAGEDCPEILAAESKALITYV